MQHIADHSSHSVFNGDFNVNWLVEAERESLYNVMVRDNGYRKLVDNPTTDNKHLLTIYIYTVIIKQCGCHAKKDRPTANELGTVERQLSHFYRMKQQ